MNISRTILIALMSTFLACATSTSGPGAGAAEGVVRGNVDNVNQHAEHVFKEMNIHETGSSIAKSGSERTLRGKMGDSEVTVEMDTAGTETTHVKVDVSKNFAAGEKDAATKILDRIVAES